jgi:hypothetical protein
MVMLGAAQGQHWEGAAASIDNQPIERLSNFLPKRLELPARVRIASLDIGRNAAHGSLLNPSPTNMLVGT